MAFGVHVETSHQAVPDPSCILVGTVRRTADWLAVAAAVAAVLAGIAFAASILRAGRGETAGTAAAALSSPSPAPAPATAPRGRVLALAGRDGDVLVAITAWPGGPVAVAVFEGPERGPRSGVVRVTLGHGRPRALEPGSCGEGCFSLAQPVLDGAPRKLRVEVVRDGKPTRTVEFSLPRRLRSGAALLREVDRTMDALKTLRAEETTATTAGVLRAQFEFVAPDRMRVVASDGGKTVLIGKQRWDWLAGRWVAGGATALRMPAYPWRSAGRPRLLGKDVVAGVPVQVLSLDDPNLGPTWFRLFVAADGRVLREEMLGPNHFMVDHFSGFDQPLAIEPPP